MYIYINTCVYIYLHVHALSILNKKCQAVDINNCFLVPSFLCFQLFDFVFFFCDAGNGTQGLIHARQVVYH